MRTYLKIAAEHNDPRKLARALGDVARARNMTKIAREVNLTRQGLSKALSERGNPRLGTVINVVAAIGMRMTFEPVARKGRLRSAKKRIPRSASTGAILAEGKKRFRGSLSRLAKK